MKTYLSKLARRASSAFGKLADQIATSAHRHPYQLHFDNWFADNGDKTLRLNYKLNPSSVVFDVGGYEGQWAVDIYAKYGCTIHVFEPVSVFADAIKARFTPNPRITIHNIGLGSTTRNEFIAIAGNSSSTYSRSSQQELVRIVAASEFIGSHHIGVIDLMKINIEGGEYELLPHLIDTGLIQHITNIQVQFHHFVPDAEARMKTIQNRLTQTHRLTWQYPFVWENWQIARVP